ncbi:MAG TPA: 7-cyano-7-deazaguanine synthase [Pirellulales bacterium]|jgi:7-cyano-7-deazaguanine synthase|nr:7-cyano-7-deazaguanine synthase [Pirellulales bacterium]
MNQQQLSEVGVVGVLCSGGLDSAILVGHLLAAGKHVQPFYIESQLYWQRAELLALRRWLEAIRSPRLAELVVLDLPLGDLYRGHWSVTGRSVPDDRSPDEAVFLPGRNALLIVKAALWCQLHAIGELALATLATNPFGDSSDEFFGALERALNLGGPAALRIVRPMGHLTKQQVMQLGRAMPLERTFSCIAPVNLEHCGRCNKCAERHVAFTAAGMHDPTVYAHPLRGPATVATDRSHYR